MKPTVSLTSPHIIQGDCQAVVVGAGIIGASCALYLARSGARVIVVDHAPVGSGTTSASGSSVLEQTKSSPLLIDLTRRSKLLYGELAKTYGIPYRTNGSYILFRGRDEEEFVRERARWLDRNGVRVEILARSDVRKMLPDVADSVQGASFAPEDAEVSPQDACRGIARGAMELGVEFRIGQEATAIEVRQGRVRGVNTPSGRIAASHVIIAAGRWSSDLLNPIGIRIPIRPQKGELLYTAPQPTRLRGRILGAQYLMSKFAMKQEEGAFAVGLAVGQEADGVVKIGSTREWAAVESPKPTLRGRDALLTELSGYLPAIASLPIERQTAGFRPTSMIGRPFIASVRDPAGLLVATGHGGDGIALAPVTGWLISQIAAALDTGYEQPLGMIPDQQEHAP